MNIQQAKEKFENTIKIFKDDLNGIQAGKVTEVLLKNIIVSFEDGSKMNLLSICSIKVADKRSLSVHPYYQDQIITIEKAISNAGLGVNTTRQSHSIIVTFPEITQERRVELAKLVTEYTNKAKNSARDIRRHFLKENEANSKEENIKLEKEIQTEIDNFNKNIDDLTKNKQNEILNINSKI